MTNAMSCRKAACGKGGGHATEHAINELIAAGNEEELQDLLISMEEMEKYR
jgi:hypothetical protein